MWTTELPKINEQSLTSDVHLIECEYGFFYIAQMHINEHWYGFSVDRRIDAVLIAKPGEAKRWIKLVDLVRLLKGRWVGVDGNFYEISNILLIK